MNTSATNLSAHSISQAKYDKAHTTGFHMKLNNESDADILQWLSEQDSKQGAIKNLIRADIYKSNSSM